MLIRASQVALVVNKQTNKQTKNARNARDIMRPGFNPWIGKIPWRRAWQPTPIFLPGESSGQGSLAGYGS